MKLSIQKTAYLLLALTLGVVILKEAEIILKPLAFALLATTIFLKPSQFLERYGFTRFWSVFTSIVFGSILMIVIGFFVASQVVQIMKMMNSEVELQEAAVSIANNVNDLIPLDMGSVSEANLNEELNKWAKEFGMPLLGNTFSFTGRLLSSLVLTIVYTFLILLYRSGIADILTHLGKKVSTDEQASILRDILKTGKHYISGLSLLILILGLMYAVTFWAFGVDYPLLFAGLAALLAVIPYVGTTIGAALPVVYAYLTHDNHWIAFGLICSIIVIQTLEGNFLTPKIVGGQMKLNPLASIMALALGGYIWGLAGMILFLPMAAMARIFAEHVTNLKAFASLSGEEITHTELNNGDS